MKNLPNRKIIFFIPILLIAFVFFGIGLFKPDDFLSKQKRFEQGCTEFMRGTHGAIVVMDCTEGKILAIVNPKEAIGRAYPPGSIFKIITATCALEENVTNLDRKVNCQGGDFMLDGYKLHCPMTEEFGDMDIINALAQSCNKYFYTICNELTYRKLLHYCREFHLGQPTGINLPDEIDGTLPKPLSKRQFLDFCIGNYPGLQITPVQAATMTAAVANGGFIYQPQIIRNKNELDNFSPRVIKRLPYYDSFRIIKEGMRLSVINGTSKKAKSNDIAIAGKTGTSTAIDGGGLTHSWFVGFAPYNKPQIAVAIFHRQGFGSINDAPLGKKVFELYFDIFGRQD